MQLTSSRKSIKDAISSYQRGERSPGARDAKTWYIQAPDQQLLPLKHVVALASGSATRDFNTSDAISTVRSLGFHAVFLGDDLLVDIAKIQQTQGAKSTVIEQLILARVGQGSFRTDLLKERPHCFATGYSDCRLLVASHIKPWARSSDKERLNPKNGLLLIPQLDRAFDRGLISFEDDGKVLISASLQQSKLLGIHGRLKLAAVAGREQFLDYHRRNVFLPPVTPNLSSKRTSRGTA